MFSTESVPASTQYDIQREKFFGMSPRRLTLRNLMKDFISYGYESEPYAFKGRRRDPISLIKYHALCLELLVPPSAHRFTTFGRAACLLTIHSSSRSLLMA